MSLPRRAGTLLAAVAVTLGVAWGAVPAHAAVTAPAVAAAALPTCNILLQGQRRYHEGRWWVCRYVRGIGYFWLPESFMGCAAPRAATRLTAVC